MSILLTRTQVAEKLGLRVRAVDRLVKEGKLPRPVRLAAHTPRWPENEIAEVIEALKLER